MNLNSFYLMGLFTLGLGACSSAQSGKNQEQPLPNSLNVVENDSSATRQPASGGAWAATDALKCQNDVTQRRWSQSSATDACRRIDLSRPIELQCLLWTLDFSRTNNKNTGPQSIASACAGITEPQFACLQTKMQRDGFAAPAARIRCREV